MQLPAPLIGVVESTARYTDFYVDNNGGKFDGWSQPTGSGGSYNGNLFAGHTGQANFLFMNGHAKSMKPQVTLDTGDGGTNTTVNLWTNDNSPFVGGNVCTDASGCVVVNYSANLYK